MFKHKAVLLVALTTFLILATMKAEGQSFNKSTNKAGVQGQEASGSTDMNRAGQPIVVKEIKFNWGTGSFAIDLKERDRGKDAPISAPEYMRNAKNKSAAYVKGSALKVKVKFEAQSPLSEVTIWAEGSIGGLTKQKVNFGGTTSSSYVDFNAPKKLPNKVGITRLVWKWKYQDSSGITRSMGQASHMVYTTHSAPLSSPVYRELLEWTCDWAKNGRNEKQIADAII